MGVRLGVFALLALLATACSDSQSPRPPTLTDGFYMCQQFITPRLRAPSSVKWPPRPHSQYVTKIDDTTFRASAYLDAQNAFGAMIRTPFVCTVQHVVGDRWRLLDLQMHD